MLLDTPSGRYGGVTMATSIRSEISEQSSIGRRGSIGFMSNQSRRRIIEFKTKFYNWSSTFKDLSKSCKPHAERRAMIEHLLWQHTTTYKTRKINSDLSLTVCVIKAYTKVMRCTANLKSRYLELFEWPL